MTGGKLATGAFSVVGSRDEQQDKMHMEWKSGQLLAVVCDGMGGMKGGSQASEAAVQVIFEKFNTAAPIGDQDAEKWMQQTMSAADERVAALKGPDGEPLGGGSTCVMVLADDEGFRWCCVGDSRIMLLREGGIMTLTRMHNFNLRIDDMLKSGRIRPEEIETLGTKGEALISFLGIGGLPLIDTASRKTVWYPGDVLILCSDGLYKTLDQKQIQAVIEESGGILQLASERLCSNCVRLAVRKQDNTTVILISKARKQE